jgi:SHS2 domain-containing protein
LCPWEILKDRKMPFFYRDDLAAADIAFQAQAETLEELFDCAWRALLGVMVRDSGSIRKREKRELKLRKDSPSMLLLAFLEEALFYKDAQTLFLLPDHIKITHVHDTWELTARLTGETIDGHRHELGTDVKAVTLHGFEFEHTDKGWSTTVVLDI